jgi:hypothetical protein
LESKRKCIACGELRPKSELIKITKEHKSGNIVIQPDSKTFGRSAYICKNCVCIKQALSKNRLGKLLKTNINEALLDKFNTFNC